MTVKQLCLSFKGRINRSIYWFCMVSIIVVISVSVVFTVETEAEDFLPAFIVFFWIPALSSLFVFLTVTVKRLHDINRSGVYVLMVLIPIMGLVYLLVVCGFIKGAVGENDYGPPVDGIT